MVRSRHSSAARPCSFSPLPSRRPATLDTTSGAVGSSFIIHANEDDQVTDATNGGSGARIACAVIHAD